MIHKFRYFLLLFISLLLYTSSFAQGFLEVSGVVDVDRTLLKDCEITVLNNGVKKQTYKTNANGKFEFRLPINNDFTVEFSKSGLITQKFRFITNIPASIKQNQIFVFELNTSLFEKFPDIDYSAMNQPLVVVEYAEDIKDFYFDEKYALDMNDKVMAIEQKIKDIKRQKERFDTEILKADNLFALTQLDKAKLSYIRAIKIKGDESYPKEKITEIDRLIAANANTDAYNKLLAEGDRLFKEKIYDKAKENYSKASTQNTTDKYPKDRIIEIDNILSNLANQKVAYDKAIAEAEDLFKNNDLEKAKAAYQKAAGINNAEKYPKDKIDQINATLAASQNSKQAYDRLVTTADNLFSKKQLNEAKVQYQAALKILPKETYPINRIAEIDKVIALNQNIEQTFNTIISQADKLLAEKEYEKAKEQYQNALNIKPLAQYPKDKIALINTNLTQIQGKKQNYDNAIANADRLYNTGEIAKARDSYTTASTIYPNEAYPKKQITQIDLLLADQKTKKERYSKLLADADASLFQKDYAKAKNSYQEAQSVLPDESYPTTKIKEINNIMALQQSKDQNYYKTISDADNAFNNKQFTVALDFYRNATTLKPDEKYPKDKLVEINDIMNKALANKKNYDKLIYDADQLLFVKNYEKAKETYLQASTLLTTEKYPKDKIAEINNAIAEIQTKEATYGAAIADGDKLFLEKEYAKAKTLYLKANGLKPQESYPQQKIAETDQLLASQVKNEQIYSKAIADGDFALKTNDIEKAHQFFATASDLKPDMQYPKDKIAEINKLKTEKQDQAILYDNLINTADKLYLESKFNEAKTNYSKALEIKPSEKYPKEKITEINAIANAELSRNQAYANAIADADKFFSQKNYDQATKSYSSAQRIKSEEQYPKDKMAEIAKIREDYSKQEKEKQYQLVLKSADSSLATKEYKNAKDKYVLASKLKPEQQYPLDKIAEITSILEKEQNFDAAYFEVISKGDRLFNAKKYDLAIKSYQEASKMKPGEQYPKTRIKDASTAMSAAATALASETKLDDRAEIELLIAPIFVANQTEKKIGFTPLAQRNSTYVIMKIKNKSGVKNSIFLYYGQDDKKSGGFIVNIASDSDEHEYTVQVNEHVKWKSITNNWFSIFSDQGAFEITSFKIIKGK